MVGCGNGVLGQFLMGELEGEKWKVCVQDRSRRIWNVYPWGREYVARQRLDETCWKMANLGKIGEIPEAGSTSPIPAPIAP